MDREGDSFQVSPRPLGRDAACRVLQTIGVTPSFRPQGYVVAVFHALNNAQCVLLDYTDVGEVRGHEGSSEVGAVDSTCSLGDKVNYECDVLKAIWVGGGGNSRITW